MARSKGTGRCTGTERFEGTWRGTTSGGARSPRRPFYRAARGLSWGGRAAAAGALLVLGSSCVNFIPPEQDVQLGIRAYGEILQGQPIVQSGPQAQMVQEVTEKLVAAVHVEDPEIAELFEWEVTLIDDPEMVNAFCLPGGKMAVYTGILPVTEGVDGLAVVMGHEIAHATQRHGTEALSRQLLVEPLLAYIAGDRADLASSVTNVLLHMPLGREAELEADRVGLLYMARAGYDPREAVEFWQRMAALGGDAPIEFLSTHPSNERRIEQLRELLPEAVALWEETTGGGGGIGTRRLQNP